MTWFVRGFAAVAAALAVVALVAGHPLPGSGMALTAVGLLITSVDTRRREAERRAAFAQRLRAARREPQAAVVVGRLPGGLTARLVPVWVDVDGEARGQLAPGVQEVFPVSAGARVVTVRRPWSSGRPLQVFVPPGGTAVVDA
ncbi:hypothetical protein SAMN03159343_0092 [Klenkia marina]|uniref:Uncharacterized protein n=1 Tax=Klenkia marina TaxID=1960309 RepID=A0A1G4X867_9ACTN|nr:hypothetical protein [Klenkia marina]SCX37416.1 hypothetical protein SAMN03159343_0092 [Klenkia marina]